MEYIQSLENLGYNHFIEKGTRMTTDIDYELKVIEANIQMMKETLSIMEASAARMREALVKAEAPKNPEPRETSKIYFLQVEDYAPSKKIDVIKLLRDLLSDDRAATRSLGLGEAKAMSEGKSYYLLATQSALNDIQEHVGRYPNLRLSIATREVPFSETERNTRVVVYPRKF